MRRCRILLFLSTAIILLARASSAQQLTPEWIYGEEGSKLARVPSHVWMEDGSAILYDTSRPAAQRTFEKLDPATGARRPVLDMAKAVASLNVLAPGAETKAALDWPRSFDRAGQRALYIFKGDVFLLDLATASFIRITDTAAEEKDAEFSPDGRLVSFVRDNDIYVYDLAAKQEKRLTRDGSQTLLNGTLSWVYWEEVFGRRDIGYWWSPDSKAIAYLQSDESQVPVSLFVDFAPVDERVIRQPYPKAGQNNPTVRVGIVEVADPQPRWVAISDKPHEWILRVKWLPDSRSLSVTTLDRAQTELGLYFAGRTGGAARRILTETDPAWVNITDDLTFLRDGQHFLWASERDGYMHLYRYRMDGALVNQITRGEWAVASSGGLPFWVRSSIVGVDEKNDWIYFTALKDSSLERHLYRVHSDGSQLARIDTEPGAHGISMSPDTRFYFDTYSNIRTLPALRLHAADGHLRSVLAAPRSEALAALDLQYPELVTIPAADGFPMPAQILKPKSFDPARKYPVILHIYGGPAAPTVKNAWQPGIFFDNLLLQEGFIVVNMDNRSATGISKTLENTILLKSPEPETADLLAGVRWLKSQPWVDGSRVGATGWSGGGTMTLSLMTHSQEFKAGISGAPVTDWRFYDSKWAEALMKLPQDDPGPYDRSSLVRRAGDLHGTLLLIFGTYDDNVHPQNEQAFIDALIKAGKPYQVMIYPMRKHGFLDTPAKVHRDKAMLDFWKKNL